MPIERAVFHSGAWNIFWTEPGAAPPTPIYVPVASFIATINGTVVTFDGSASYETSGTIASYAWDFGDGGKIVSGTSAVVTHAYAKTSSYSVTLTVTDAVGAQSSTTTRITATTSTSNPIAAFTKAVSGLAVTVDGSASTDTGSSITSYTWDFGDGATGTGVNQSHTYATSGAKTISLTVTDGLGATSVASAGIVVSGAPTAAFTATVVASTPTSGSFTYADVAHFQGTINWGSYSLPGVMIKLGGSNSGTYTDSAYVTNVSGARANGVHIGHYWFNGTGDPAADAQYFVGALSQYKAEDFLILDVEAESGTAGTPWTPAKVLTFFQTVKSLKSSARLMVYMNNSNTTAYDWSSVVNYGVKLWDASWGANNGSRGTAPTPGGWSSYSLWQYTSVGTTTGITGNVDLSYTTTDLFPSYRTVDVNGATSTGPNPISTYAWAWGDGTTTAATSSRTVSHTYAAAGTYQITLTVKDSTGQTDTQTNSVIISASGVTDQPPVASFQTNVTNLTLNVDGSASSDLDGTIASYAWNFGDGATGTGVTASHVYATAGTYTVKLTVTDNLGSTSSLSRSVVATAVANQPPVASFTVSATNLAVSVNASASSDPDGTIASYAWNFGDSATASGVTASHTYTTAGTYTIKLTVTDNGGATDALSRSVSVTAAPAANQPPIASFTTTANNLAVTVNASGSSDPDGSIGSYVWNFGDGSSASVPGFTAAWGTRTATSTALTYSNLSNFTISGKYFTNIGSDVASIRLTNCSNVTIEQNDFDSDCEAIVLTNCSNITIRYNRANNITGPHTRNGSNRGNFLQAISCGAGIYVGYNIIVGGDTEDMISIYQCNGTSANPIIVERNQITNPSYTSGSGSGIMLGDGGGSWQIARNNILNTPGQVGVAAAGGTNITIDSNTVYGVQTTRANIGIYAYPANNTGPAMTAIAVTNNKVRWKNSTGAENDFYSTLTGTDLTNTGNSFPASLTAPSISITMGDPTSSSSTGVTTSHTYSTAGTYTITLTVTDNLGAVATASRAITVSSTPSGIPAWDHIIYVWMENHSETQIIGSSSAPYINTLANANIKFTNAQAVAHPSQPNYIAAFSGSTQGITDDNNHDLGAVANIFTQLQTKGLTMKGYVESPGVRKHNPWESFSNTTGCEVAFSSFPTNYATLPKLCWVVPNLTDDMHDGTITQGDTWLKTNIDPVITWAKANNSLVIITWDEDDSSSTNGNDIPLIMAGAHTVAGSYSTAVDHYSILGMIQDSTGVPRLVNSVGKPALSGPFTTGTVNQPPVASFKATVTSLTVALNASGSTDADGTIASYAWDFGDSATGTGVTTSHTYSSAGTYTVRLTVTDNSGSTSSVSQSVVAPPVVANQPPVASFQAAATGLVLNVNGSASSDSDGSIASYAWDFGDGATGTGVTASHTYATAGTYAVKLTITDNASATGSTSKSVAVATTAATTGDPGVNQTGTAGKQQTTGGTLYQNLSGSTVQAKVTAGGTAGVSFAAGTFEWPSFSGSGTSGVGIEFVAGTMNILGAGSASTILRMTANSDHVHTNLSSGTTGLFDTHINNPADGWIIDGVNFQGTPQTVSGAAAGNPATTDLLYHGMQIENPGNGTISNTTFSGFPGNAGSPPGETFGLSIHSQAAGKTLVVKNSTFDGKQVATGANVASAISGTNTTNGVVTFQDCLFQNTGHSAGLALWEIASGGTVNLIRPVFKNCFRNLGNEAQGGVINIYDPMFYVPTQSGEDDIRITWTSNYNSGKINLYFTAQSDLNAMMSARGNKKLTSQTATQQNYGGSAGGVYTGNNLIYNSCHVFVAGVEVDKTLYWTVPAGR